MYICLLLLFITLFVCHFVSPCEVSEGIVRLYLCQQFFCLSVWSFTFIENPYVTRWTMCILWLVQPQSWSNYCRWFDIVTSLAMCQSVWLFLCIFRRYIFHIIPVLCLIHLVLEEGPGVPVIIGSLKKTLN